jgi:tRNA G18 (ribose-2'-O)-methylase SpoU
MDSDRTSDLGTVQVRDPQDPALADYVDLTDVQLRQHKEITDGLFVAEGDLVMTRALDAGHVPRSWLFSEARWRLLDEALRTRVLAGRAPVLLGSPELLYAVTGFSVHRGALASFHRGPMRSLAEVLTGARRVVVLEQVNNHTNVGAIIRGAAALGMDAALLCPRTADPFYRRALRTSMGTVFTLPWTRLDPWESGLQELAAQGWTLAALTPSPQAVDLREVRTQDYERLALIMGSEGEGLTVATLAACELHLRIRMSGGVDSLNVAAATAVACWALG